MSDEILFFNILTGGDDVCMHSNLLISLAAWRNDLIHSKLDLHINDGILSVDPKKSEKLGMILDQHILLSVPLERVQQLAVNFIKKNFKNPYKIKLCALHGHNQFGAFRKFFSCHDIELNQQYLFENEFIDLASIINYLVEQKKLAFGFKEDPFRELDLPSTNHYIGFANQLAKTYKHIQNLKKRKIKPNMFDELQLNIFN